MIQKNRTQTEYKPDTNQTQTERNDNIKNTLIAETEHKLDTKLNTKLDTNQTQFSILTGLQRAVALFFYKHCKESRRKITAPISLEFISTVLNIRIGSVKTTLQRLQNKNFINRIEFKNGRGGWSRYEVPDRIFKEIMQLETEYKLDTNWTQTGYKLDTTVSSGNNDNYTKTTTTMLISEEWSSIDTKPLGPIGFTVTHLSQIASQNKLSPEIVQNSILAFAFDLQKNDKAKKIKGDPINFFMGILRNGKPYTPPGNYESPQDEAMRLYKEKMHEQEQKRMAIEKEAINLAFRDWFVRLTDEQKIKTFPEMLRHNMTSEKLKTSKKVEDFAKSHFEASIWPIEKAKIVTLSQKIS